MSNKPTQLTTYFFVKESNGEWKFYDQYGDDKILDLATFRQYIQPHLNYDGLHVTDRHIYLSPIQQIWVDGYGSIKLKVKIYESENKIFMVSLLTEENQVIVNSTKNFVLLLPDFDGKDWPYLEDDHE